MSSDQPGLSGLLAHWRSLLIPRQPEYNPKPWRRAYLLASFVTRRFFMEDRCGGMAAILTIHTLLSTVPIIGVALLVVGLMDQEAGARLMHDLFRSLVPETSRAEKQAEIALDFAGQVTIDNLGVWGFLVALVIAFILFQHLEKTFNLIWRASRKRNLLIKFTMFYTLATLGPLLMLYSLAHPVLPGMGWALGTPLVTTSLGLILLNRFLPFTKVRWRGAVIGGLFSAVLIELAKYGFGLYATRFALRTYEGMYGPLGLFPILIIWSYLSWMVVLGGAEIAYVVQHRRSIALLGYMNRYVLDRLAIQRPSGRTAARVFLAIADQHSRRDLGLSADDLAERFEVGLDVILEILSRLTRAELVVEVESPAEVFVPARPLDQVRIVDVISLFDRDHSRHTRDDRLSKVFDELDENRDRQIGDTTYAHLVALPRGEADGPLALAGPDGERP